MRRTILAAVAAPLALTLGACGDSVTDERVVPEESETQPEPAVPVDLPDVPARVITTIDYPGSYARTESGGSETRLRLDADNSYVLTRADGTTVSGTYSRTEDGTRLRLENYDGGPAYFSAGTGAIYRLADENTPYDQVTAEGRFARDAEATGATSTTG
jgi:hypothetical protein